MNITKKLVPAAAIGGGAIAAGFVSKYVPVENDKVKAAAPLLLGVFLMTRKGIIADLGAGMVAGGALKLAQSFGIGAVESEPIMAIDEIDEIEVDGVDEGVVSGAEFEEDEMA